MDDPWGSPWADEVAQSSSVPKASKSTQQRPVTPPKAFQLNEGSRSLWDDEEEFGEWTALPSSDELGTGISSRVDELSVKRRTVVPENELIPEKRDGDHSVCQDWFTQDTQLSSQTHPALTEIKSEGSQASPEPWMEGNLREVEAVHSPEFQTSDMTRSIPRSDPTLNGDLEDDSPPQFAGLTSTDQTTQREEQLATMGVLRMLVETSLTNSSELKLECKTESKPKPISPVKGLSQTLRLSSSTSDCSPHDEAFAESPSTSFDEELESQSNAERKWCTHATAKVGSHSALTSGVAKEGRGEDQGQDSLVRTPGRTDSKDDFDDLQSFGDKSSGDIAGSRRDPMKLSPEEISASRTKDDIRATERLKFREPSFPQEELQPDGYSQPTQRLASVEFDVDVELITKMFVQGESLPPKMTSDIHDLTDIESIIQNSFHSTEQRKVWYRISRYGTTRKHNAGDEENYVRIKWNNSDIRAESIKIVARWIEEDRSGGGLSTGGSGRSGSLFGWGQKHAAPISITEVLAKKGGGAGPNLDSIMQRAEPQPPERNKLQGQTLKENPSAGDCTLKQIPESTLPIIAPKFSWSTGMPPRAAMNIDHTSVSSARLASLQRPNDFGPGPKEILGQSPFLGRGLEGYPSFSPSELFQQQMPTEGNATVSVNDSSALSTSAILEFTSIKAHDKWGEIATASSNPTPITVQPPAQRYQALDSLAQALGPDSAFISPTHAPTSYTVTKATNSDPRVKMAEPPDMSSIVGSDAPYQSVTASPISSQPILNAATPKQNTLATDDKTPKEESEHDIILKNIVQNLPNLSYMLRR